MSFIGESSRRFPLSAETFRSGNRNEQLLLDTTHYRTSAGSPVDMRLTSKGLKGGHTVLLHQS